jgi:hypothetical protein
MPVPHVPQPQQRSVSATSASSTATVTSVPPRTRSLHHQTGPGKISVRIPSPTLGGTSLLPFPEAPGSEVRAPSPPPDYQRAMSAVDLNSDRGTPYDHIPGLPRSSGNAGGPWEPSGNEDYFSSGELTHHTRMPRTPRRARQARTPRVTVTPCADSRQRLSPPSLGLETHVLLEHCLGTTLDAHAPAIRLVHLELDIHPKSGVSVLRSELTSLHIARSHDADHAVRFLRSTTLTRQTRRCSRRRHRRDRTTATALSTDSLVASRWSRPTRFPCPAPPQIRPCPQAPPRPCSITAPCRSLVAA